MRELTVEATIKQIETVTNFVDEQLEAAGCPQKILAQIHIAVDELFGNIAKYAYGDSVGTATVRVENREDPRAVAITFLDRGMPYDPLARTDPDVTLCAEERGIGGLGIFMVKKSMDMMSYQYQDGQNILEIVKKY